MNIKIKDKKNRLAGRIQDSPENRPRIGPKRELYFQRGGPSLYAELSRVPAGPARGGAALRIPRRSK